MSDGWYGPAIDNHASKDAGAHLGPVTVGVLHKTVSKPGSFRARRGDYFGHQSYPHFTTDVQGGVFKVWQHISIRRCAKALANDSGGVQTNREGVIQIEVVGYADGSDRLHPDPRLHAIHTEGLRRLMRWIESQTLIPRSTGVKFHAYPPPGGVRLGREPWRMSFAKWREYEGWCAHQHVPENEHGDALFDIAALLREKPVPVPDPGVTPAPEPEPLEDSMYAVYTGGDNRDWGTDLVTRRRFASQAEKAAWIGLVQRVSEHKVGRIVLSTAEEDALVDVTPTG